jgi:hypothetical protein
VRPEAPLTGDVRAVVSRLTGVGNDPTEGRAVLSPRRSSMQTLLEFATMKDSSEVPCAV